MGELLRTQDLALHRVCHKPYGMDLRQQFARAAVFLGIDPDLPVILCSTDTLRGSFHPEQIGGCGTPVNPYPGFGEQKDNPLLIQPVIRESQMFQMLSGSPFHHFQQPGQFHLAAEITLIIGHLGGKTIGIWIFHLRFNHQNFFAPFPQFPGSVPRFCRIRDGMNTGRPVTRVPLSSCVFIHRAVGPVR